mgnify:CR=1 FL=1
MPSIVKRDWGATGLNPASKPFVCNSRSARLWHRRTSSSTHLPLNFPAQSLLSFPSSLMVQPDTYRSQRERTRSPRRGRSRSPGRSVRRRSYSPRSRSRSRDDYRRNDRRSRTPMNGGGVGAGGGSGAGSAYGGAPQRSFEERAAAKEQMLSTVRESSQQDRRVYVGNLAYDVKWHHLKDFMRQG